MDKYLVPYGLKLPIIGRTFDEAVGVAAAHEFAEFDPLRVPLSPDRAAIQLEQTDATYKTAPRGQLGVDIEDNAIDVQRVDARDEYPNLWLQLASRWPIPLDVLSRPVGRIVFRRFGGLWHMTAPDEREPLYVQEPRAIYILTMQLASGIKKRYRQMDEAGNSSQSEIY